MKIKCRAGDACVVARSFAASAGASHDLKVECAMFAADQYIVSICPLSRSIGESMKKPGRQ